MQLELGSGQHVCVMIPLCVGVGVGGSEAGALSHPVAAATATARKYAA